jgi:hypothetical protein
MAHRSRLGILLLDLPPEHHVAGIDFWSAATGHPITPDASDDDWNSLGVFGAGFHLEVQRTGEGTPPRWHVDVDTDDIPAEVSRLEALGARRHRDMGSFWQMTDPAGLVFCVVGVQTGEAFEEYAVTWP